MTPYVLLSLAAVIGTTLAKTDYDGCVSSKVIRYGGASLLWYVPDTGEICQYLDCGGGRAPPKTTVPGCGFYSGTATYSPSFLPGYGSAAPATSTSSTTAMDSLPTLTSTVAYATSSSVDKNPDSVPSSDVSSTRTEGDMSTGVASLITTAPQSTITTRASVAVDANGTYSSVAPVASSSDVPTNDADADAVKGWHLWTGFITCLIGALAVA